MKFALQNTNRLKVVSGSDPTSMRPIIARGRPGQDGVTEGPALLVLNVGDPIPDGTPAGTVIVRI